MLDVLQIVVMSLHLILVNVAVAGPLVCVWLDWRAARHDEPFARGASHRLAAQSLVALFAGVVLGIFGFGLIHMAYPEAVNRGWTTVPAQRWWFGAVEVLFSAACVWGYLRWWNVLGRNKLGTVIRYCLPVLAATNLAYHFAPLFAMVAVWSTRATPPGEFDYLQLIRDPEIASRTLHVLLASIAVTGVVLMGSALRMARLGTEAKDTARIAVWGARIALVPSLLQVFVGLYVLISLPELARDRMMGGDVLTCTLFVAALAATLAWYYMLMIVALGGAERRDIARCMSWMTLVIVLMVAARHYALSPQYAQAVTPTETSQDQILTPEPTQQATPDEHTP